MLMDHRTQLKGWPSGCCGPKACGTYLDTVCSATGAGASCSSARSSRTMRPWGPSATPASGLKPPDPGLPLLLVPLLPRLWGFPCMPTLG